MTKIKKFTLWCDQAMAVSFYALIYFLPISIALAETFTVSALVFYLLKRGAVFFVNYGDGLRHGIKQPLWRTGWEFLKAFKPINNYLNWPIAIYLFISIISVLLSRHHRVSLEGFLGKSLQSAFLYFNFIECMNSRKRLKAFVTIFFISCTLICVNGIYQLFVGHGFIHGKLVYDGRISSCFRAHNDFAGYLVSVIPLLISLSLLATVNDVKKFCSAPARRLFLGLIRSQWAAMIIFILLILAFICLGFTYSRGAWIALVLAMLFIGMQKKRNMAVALLTLVIFFSVFYPKLTRERTGGLIIDPITHEAQVELQHVSANGEGQESGEGGGSLASIYWQRIMIMIRHFSGSGRMGYWREAINMIKDYPTFGVGLNTYSIVGRGYKITWGGYPHNCYLQMAVEIGLIGLSSFLWIVFVVFRNNSGKFKQIHDPFLQFTQLGALTGYGGFLVHGFFDTSFYSVQLGSLMWLLMGLIVASDKIIDADKSVEGPGPQ